MTIFYLAILQFVLYVVRFKRKFIFEHWTMFVYSILDRDLTFEEINLIPLQIFKANDHLLLFFENCLNMKTHVIYVQTALRGAYTHSAPCQTTMDHFAKIVNKFRKTLHFNCLTEFWMHLWGGCQYWDKGPDGIVEHQEGEKW